jgi:hypothetical protein
MIPISSWYHHDRVMTVFCLSGIITVPILAIFTKPSMLSHDTQFDDTQPINQNCANQLLELSELKKIILERKAKILTSFSGIDKICHDNQHNDRLLNNYTLLKDI